AATGSVAWGKENAAASGVADRPIRWIVDDCVKFVERELRRGHKYDAIIMDPPSYGRGPGGEVWKLENSIWDFVSLTAGLLSSDPLFVIINSYTTGLSASSVKYIADSVFTPRFGGHSECGELGLPVSVSGLALPCGAACRWEAGT
ncbi:MAG: SAM-dependent methyltransferase, partial [Oscillospiraceae bacterium]|nr:SAM-dependent methyltransferase [Oscillospiraceae bacterium]